MRAVLLSLAGLSVFACVLLAGPAGARANEEILSFASRIEVHADATLTITETIKVRAAGQQIKRGIYRDFPTTYQDRFGNTKRVAFNVVSATRNGHAVRFWVENRSGGKRLYMGDKNVRIAPGIYTFAFTYTTDRQVGYFEGFDEIYWNVTGNDWSFPINHAEAVVVLPPGTPVMQKTAYTGRHGVAGKDFQMFTDTGGSVRFATTRTLAPGQGLTIAVGWPKGYVREPTEGEKAAAVVKDNLSILAGAVGFLLVLAYYLYAWDRVGRDPEAGTIAPLFEPPEGFSPAAVRYVQRMSFDKTAFSAAVVDMAVKGHVEIEDNGWGRFVLRRATADMDTLSPGEAAVKSRLFSGRKSIELDNDNHETISGAIDVLEQKLEDEFQSVHFRTNLRPFVVGAVLSAVALAGVAAFSADPGQAIGTILVLALPVGFIIFIGRRAWRLWAGPKTISTVFQALVYSVALPILILMGIGFMAMTAEHFPALAVLAIVMIVLLNPLFYHLLKAPTVMGRRVMDRIEGFKMYLATAERHRLEALHPPDDTPALFEKYLPYALALGVANKWSERFATVLAQAAQAGSEYQPRWYHGSAWSRGGVTGMTSQLGSSFSAAAASASVAPGSSGGGFSGGGGGGGGGGGF